MASRHREAEDLRNVDVHGLVGAAQSGEEVRNLLAMVDDVDAQQLEGNNTSLAGGLQVQGGENASLVQGGGDVDTVQAGDKEKVVDGEVATFWSAAKLAKVTLPDAWLAAMP